MEVNPGLERLNFSLVDGVLLLGSKVITKGGDMTVNLI